MPLVEEAIGAITDLRAALEPQDVGVHTFVYSAPSRLRKHRQDCWKRLSLSGDLNPTFLNGILASLAAFEGDVADGAIAEFDYDTMAERQIGVQALAHGELENWLADIPNEDWPHLLDVTDQDYVSKIRFFVSIVSFADGRTLKIYRGRRGLEVILTKPGMIAAFMSGAEQELVEVNGPILTIDQKIDFMVWDNCLYVQNFSSFEIITNIREVTRKRAVECLAALGTRFGIPHLDEVQAAVGQKTALAKKLAAAAKHGLMADLNGPAVISRITQKGLGISCVDQDGNFTFNFDPSDAVQVREFVELISDAYLHSPTTGREWYAVVKRPA